MSDHAVKKEPKKTSSKALKWLLVILVVAVLEVGGIAGAVKITEMRRADTNNQVKAHLEILTQQLQKLDSLEKLSSLVAVNMQHLEATSHAVNLLSESFGQLEKEVGGNQIAQMSQKIAEFNSRINNLEETQSIEPIILAVALMIKEDSLSARSFAEKADVLSALCQDIPALKEDVKTVQLYENDIFESNQTMAAQYKDIMADFSFKQEVATAPEESKDTLLSKGVDVLKNTVSSLHFDKVAVLKKQKKTDEEKQLIANLDTLVDGNQYDEVLVYVKAHTEFGTAGDKAFNNWLISVEKKVIFEKALNHIIAEQLKSLRKDVGNLAVLKPQNSEKTPSQSNETKEISNEKVL